MASRLTLTTGEVRTAVLGGRPSLNLARPEPARTSLASGRAPTTLQDVASQRTSLAGCVDDVDVSPWLQQVTLTSDSQAGTLTFSDAQWTVQGRVRFKMVMTSPPGGEPDTITDFTAVGTSQSRPLSESQVLIPPSSQWSLWWQLDTDPDVPGWDDTTWRFLLQVTPGDWTQTVYP